MRVLSYHLLFSIIVLDALDVTYSKTPIKLPKDISQNIFDIHYSFNNTIYVINQKSTFDLSWTYE